MGCRRLATLGWWPLGWVSHSGSLSRRPTTIHSRRSRTLRSWIRAASLLLILGVLTMLRRGGLVTSRSRSLALIVCLGGVGRVHGTCTMAGPGVIIAIVSRMRALRPRPLHIGPLLRMHVLRPGLLGHRTRGGRCHCLRSAWRRRSAEDVGEGGISLWVAARVRITAPRALGRCSWIILIIRHCRVLRRRETVG